MKVSEIKRFGLIALLALPLNSVFGQSPAAASNLSATEVAKLTRAGTGDDVILAYVKNSQSSFNLTADDIVSLKNEGVSAPVLTAMIHHDSALRKAQAAAATPVPVAPVTPNVAPAPAAAVAPVVAPSVVPPAPPAPRVEVITVAPGPGYYWWPGYYHWNGGAHIWIGGHWSHNHYRHHWHGGHHRGGGPWRR